MQFVLRKQAKQPVTEEDIRVVRELPQTAVLDVTTRMIVVEGDAQLLATFVEKTPGWLLAPVVQYSLHEPPRHSVRSKPSGS